MVLGGGGCVYVEFEWKSKFNGLYHKFGVLPPRVAPGLPGYASVQRSVTYLHQVPTLK
jgi:hypothetical protein